METLTESEFQAAKARRDEAAAFAARFGLTLEERERLAGQSDEELRALAGELATRRDAASACREVAPVLRERRRQLASLEALVASPPSALGAVSLPVSDADLPGQLIWSAAAFVAVRDERWVEAARAELERPGPDGFDETVGANGYRSVEAEANRERQVVLRELEARPEAASQSA